MAQPYMTREQAEQWARENLRTFDDYYEVFVGLQNAVDGVALPGVGWGDYVFRHTAKGLKKVAKEQGAVPLDQRPAPFTVNPRTKPRKKAATKRRTKKSSKRNPVSVRKLVNDALK